MDKESKSENPGWVAHAFVSALRGQRWADLFGSAPGLHMTICLSLSEGAKTLGGQSATMGKPSPLQLAEQVKL